jgi:glycerate dehydrogenase
MNRPFTVVLDGFTLNPGDLSWDGLAEFGAFAVYDRTAPGRVLERSLGARILLTNKTILDRDAIDALPELACIGVMATGYNVVDLGAADERGIPVTNVPDYSSDSVTEMTFALLLELVRHVGLHSDSVHSGEWSGSPDFSYWKTPLGELHGGTMGIVGYGRIGRKVAAVARAFGMKVLAFDIQAAADDSEVRFTGLDDLFRESDVVTLHCPLTPETEGMVNRKRLALMKREAYLINTGRGPLVNERDLAEALDSGRIAGAALDVLGKEPPEIDSPLLTARNCIITPHIAWAALPARKRLMDTVTGNIRAFLAGAPVNVVNSPGKPSR